MNKFNTIEKGYLGNLIVEKKLIENGWNIYKPILENGKVDLIIEKNNLYLRIQIKTIISNNNQRIIPVRKISHNMGTYKVKYYTDKDIDYFIGVDLDFEDLYILPIKFSQQIKSSISINRCIKFKNNFKQMELINGNINNGHNDNVESLTDNADGNDVGID